MNPSAINFWLLGTAIGYLVGETLYAAVIGAAITLSLSFIASLYFNK